ncbi:flagellar hook-associated protein 1 FlgK [Halomonas ventosae]|uniref:Flagellar hook-associated protein 1 n=1 Tax=Halomonas ventosae TaxID=229007 RepID=A0A4R6ZTK0_9GAMM|nr:flagellar hook-associated protein FlgK [Halomonas ventosae]TDR56101.1 flagellar hook-associated protein 1 FlgK [Halomonas ventosae]
MSLFSTGISGLTVARQALDTTGNNISNAYTPGFHRETAKLAEGQGDGGVRLQEVERQFNRYVSAQHNASVSALSGLEAYQSQITQLDNLLGDLESGLSPLMQNFCSALEDLSGAPSDPAARQGVIGNATTLSGQFQAFGNYLEEMQSGIEGMIRDEVNQINTTADKLATLNREISLARASAGSAPNSLLNQRDQAVAELSEHLNVTLQIQDGKSYNVYLPTGQALVAGTQVYKLDVMNSGSDPQRLVVGYQESRDNLAEVNEQRLSDGSLGGLLAFRRDRLDRAQNQIGQMAVALGESFNAQHRSGIDLNGNQGGDMFTLGSPLAYAHERNVGSAAPSVTLGEFHLDQEDKPLDDLSRLTTSDYEIRVVDGEPSIQRLDSGTSLAGEEYLYDQAAGTLTFDGMTVSFNGTLAEGDRFLVQPTKQAALGMTNQIQDTRQIATAQEGGLSGDNRNALALQQLQFEPLVGNEATISQSYAAMVSDVGNQSHVIEVNAKSQQAMTQQLRAMQQAESGVNLDEEAANLIRYQQFYQANAKVIETGTTIFDTLLSLRT